MTMTVDELVAILDSAPRSVVVEALERVLLTRDEAAKILGVHPTYVSMSPGLTGLRRRGLYLRGQVWDRQRAVAQWRQRFGSP